MILKIITLLLANRSLTHARRAEKTVALILNVPNNAR
jgi:hypothetical protein